MREFLSDIVVLFILDGNIKKLKITLELLKRKY
jgi:hypothetical protein